MSKGASIVDFHDRPRRCGHLRRSGLRDTQRSPSSWLVLYDGNAATPLLARAADAHSEPGLPLSCRAVRRDDSNDYGDGSRRHLYAVSDLGELATLVEMLTYSRSTLSMPRDGLSRRNLCGVLRPHVKGGRNDDNLPRSPKLVRDICVKNAGQYGPPDSWAR